MPAHRTRRRNSERKILDLNVVSLPRPHNQPVNPKGYRLRITIRGRMNDLDSAARCFCQPGYCPTLSSTDRRCSPSINRFVRSCGKELSAASITSNRSISRAEACRYSALGGAARCKFTATSLSGNQPAIEPLIKLCVGPRAGSVAQGKGSHTTFSRNPPSA